MWSVIDAVQGVQGGGGGSNHVDPTSLLMTALSQTMGVAMNDGSYWEDSISANEIRKSLQDIEPHQYQTHSALLSKGLKWLLASMSKGRDVSDFYVVVVKLVACPVLEIRKMVYIYLMQYANYNSTTRELSLLSINSFQRGLADPEAAIRALALRVLTAIHLPDISSIQRLAVSKHAISDKAPAVRTCAALALAKLAVRAAPDEALVGVLQRLLDEETSARVLSAALMAFTEVFSAPEQRHDNLYRLHSSYRKLCHLLTDMDEYGQIVALDLLTRYVRRFFAKPPVEPVAVRGDATLPTRLLRMPPLRRQRVVKKAFYSDEEDDSAEEEEEAAADAAFPTAAWRSPGPEHSANSDPPPEARDLDPDHWLLLRSARPLLKSRNAGVVLAVGTLHYYGGGGPSRAALGRALVRLHRSHRRQQRPEIQYVLLASMRQLVVSAAEPPPFGPHDFFVLPDLDPPFTRGLQLDILTILAVQDAASLRVVLPELRTYVALPPSNASDRAFVCAALRAVGRIAERARSVLPEAAEAHTVLLNALYGLLAFTQTAEHESLVGEAVQVMQRILYRLLLLDEAVHDPNRVRERAFHRIVLLLMHTLSCVVEYREDDDDDGGDAEDGTDEPSAALATTLVLPPDATASAVWLVGEYWSSRQPIPGYHPTPLQRRQRSLEVLRLLARAYTQLDPPEKEQAIHLATKLWVYTQSNALPGVDPLVPLCEHVLALGRLDPIPDVRDRARMESTMLHRSPKGLQYDRDGLEVEVELLSSTSGVPSKLSMEDLQRIFLCRKPAASYLPFESTTNDGPDAQDGHNAFRFGTLSSLVGHNARGAYIPFPPWAEVNSDPSLREPPVRKSSANARTLTSDDEDDSTSSSSDSSTSSDESSSASSTDDEEEPERLMAAPLVPVTNQPSVGERFAESESDESSSATSTSSEEDSAEEVTSNPSNWNTSLIPLTGGMESKANNLNSMGGAVTGAPSSSILDDMRGLVLSPAMQPVGAEPTDSYFDRDSGGWIPLLRPEHASGLLVEGRYLRGITKAQQAQAMGFLPEKPTVVLLQLRLENQKPTGSIRHIRILQRSSSTNNASVIGPKRMVLPIAIDELPAHRKTECLVGIEFISTSDRDGSLLAKLDIKFGSNGTAALDIKPSIGDVLLPCRRSIQEFDAAVHRMQGFNRAEANFVIPPLSSRAIIPARILSRAALTVVHEGNTAASSDTSSWGQDHQIRWVGTLPSSSDPIFVITRCVEGSQQGSLVVCCDHALMANSFVNLLKRAISE
jgi:AP-3 complex subunit beta